MSSSENNNTYKKTSFLAGNNSSFIKKFYSDYLLDPKKVPEDWRLFFDGLKENEEVVLKDLQGPSWSLKKKIGLKRSISKVTLQDLLEINHTIRNNKLVISDQSFDENVLLKHVLSLISMNSDAPDMQIINV